jgi:hypothetical protein
MFLANLHAALFVVVIYFFIVALGGVHCGIYKSSYNISNISYMLLVMNDYI